HVRLGGVRARPPRSSGAGRRLRGRVRDRRAGRRRGRLRARPEPPVAPVARPIAALRRRVGTLSGTTETPSRGWVEVPTGGHSPRTSPPPVGRPIRWNSGADGESPDGSEDERPAGAGPCRRAVPSPAPTPGHDVTIELDEYRMRQALDLAAGVRALTPPNPWVGCVIETVDGQVFTGATAAAGGPHAEASAIAAARAAGADLTGATAWVTLEPCAHHGRTPPCADALVEAGLGRVVVALEDPDPKVAGAGAAKLVEAGIEVLIGLLAGDARALLAPYLHHRRTGRPYVVLKLAATLDGGTAAPDGTSQWITGPEARADAHALRAESDAIIVGAGTVRADDPALTVRDAPAPRGDPLRIVLGDAPEGARIHPCRSHHGPVGDLLDDLG